MSITANIAREMSITDFNDLYTFSMPLEFDYQSYQQENSGALIDSINAYDKPNKCYF